MESRIWSSVHYQKYPFHRPMQLTEQFLTSNFSELCMPGMDCMRWEVGWLPKSELT